jgi:antirestriction protein
MKIYLANLQKYNEGKLSGKWLDITKDDLQEAALDLGEAEWAIHDYELPFKVGKHEDLYELEKVGQNWDSMSDSEQAAFCCLVNDNFCTLSEALERYNNRSVHVADSFEDLAYQFVQEGLYGEIPDSISSYVDYEKMGRDLSYDYQEYKYKDTTYFISTQ